MIEKLNLQKGNRARTIFVVSNYIFMILLMVVMLVPLLKVLSDSFDSKGMYGLSLFPSQPTIDAYKVIITNNTLSRPFMVSVFTTIAGSLLAMTLVTMGAYVLTQRQMPGRGLFVAMIMIAMVFHAGLIPTYMVVKNLGMLNTLWPIILLSAVSPFNLILMKNFFQEIPQSLIEAAEIDGCTPFGIFMKIVLPMSKPALATIGLFCIVGYWNEYMHYVIYISSNTELYNFQVRLREIVSSDDFANSSLIVSGRSLQSAVIVVAIIPVMILYPFLQKYFVKGINLGAIKG